MTKTVFVFISVLISTVFTVQAQQHYHALFLGNSYTAYNNLPQLVSDLAIGNGDTLSYEMNVPGGFTLQGHSTNATTLDLISAGSWDYVVLQEQSQRPSFPIEQVEVEVFPFAEFLDSIISEANLCAETVFYMTWGRKFGDAINCPVWPPVCTYEGMDSLLRECYITMANDNEAIVSPVGAVWRYIRTTAPWLELYSPDQSHPSQAGSFAAACAFYTVMFRKDPTLTPFEYVLDPLTVETIKNAAKAVVYDSLDYWNVGTFDPVADFTANLDATGVVSIENLSSNASSYYWDMGDGTTYAEAEPIHTYETSGTYAIQLIAEQCGRFDTIETDLIVNITTNLVSVKNSLGVEVYPIADQGGLFIKNPAGLNLLIAVTDIKGREVYIENNSFNKLSGVNPISLPAPGWYSISMIYEGATIAHCTVIINE